MKLHLILFIVPVIICSLFSLTGCGYVSKSTVHTGKAWKAHKSSPTELLPTVTLKVGERILAYKNRVGFPPIPGGYIPSLLAADESIVKAELVSHGMRHDTYLTGLKPGTTSIHFVNGLVNSAYNRKGFGENPKRYQVIVTP